METEPSDGGNVGNMKVLGFGIESAVRGLGSIV